MDLDPDKIYKKLLESGDAWADAESAAQLLEDTRKIVLAEQLIRYVPESKSVAEAENRALISQPYREHVKAMNEARRAANRARVNYDTLRALMELRRSQESTRRAEAQIR